MFPAPIAGWISNRALAVPGGQDDRLSQGAAVLDNFVPRATSVVLRRGRRRYCTLGQGESPATSLFSYKNGPNKRLFAANETTVYDITDIEFAEDAELVDDEGDNLADDDGNVFGWSSTQFLSVMGGFTGGDWSVVQFATTGGTYLIGVNGQDEGFIYDGDAFYPNVAGGVSRILYDAETSEFTEGDVLTGGSSGASATIWRVVDSGGGTGALYIYNISGGPFDDNETITDTDGGSATANGIDEIVIPGMDFGGLTSADVTP